MKNIKWSVFLLSLAMLAGCSGPRVVIDEMVITEPDKYTLLRDEPISVSTKDSVTTKTLNQVTMQTIVKRKLLNDRSVSNYKFNSDSLFVNDPYFQSAFGLSVISDIKFRGIWDSEFGFISENQLNTMLPELDGGRIVGGLLGGVLGFFLGGGLATSFYKPTSFEESLKMIFGGWSIVYLIGGTVGAGIGMYAGSNLAKQPTPDLDVVIERYKKKMREQR